MYSSNFAVLSRKFTMTKGAIGGGERIDGETKAGGKEGAYRKMT